MMESGAKRTPHGWANFALDFGPLLAFFATFVFAKGSVGSLLGALAGTFVFMIAILITMAVSMYLYRRISPMMWISAILVIGFGALTLYFHDPRFIQLKPTLIFGGFSILLFFGVVTKRPLVKNIFGPIFEGLDEVGWMNLTRNWAFFFGAMAILNEILRFTVSFDTWLFMKVWGVTALTFLFGAANLPMLLRHGLSTGDAEDEPAPPPGGSA
jgi:intracellular septation protein